MAQRQRTIDSMFKRKRVDIPPLVSSEIAIFNATTADEQTNDDHPHVFQRVEPEEISASLLERDPGKRRQICQYPVNQHDALRRAYIQLGPYQFHLDKYPLSGSEKHPRRFLSSWFKFFPNWLEYSPSTDAAYCLPCFLFAKTPTGRPGCTAFTVKGFRKWKKASGKKCAFLTHVGTDPSSTHNIAVRCCIDLMNQSRNIDKVMVSQTYDQILKNRLRLSVSIDAMKFLVFQGCSFRGHKEEEGSENRGNFKEAIKLIASYNVNVEKVVLEKAPKNAKYTSPKIQKELLEILSSKVRNYIREEIGDAKFCIIVDEARDVSKREQMSLVLRYVSTDGFIRERFFDLIRVKSTTSQTLKDKLCEVLAHHNFNIQNLRGQGYDGASNMRGEWNGLQALFLRDCPYAYYVHCFAHRLQLALVATAREVSPIQQFFTKLSFIVNTVGASCKRHTELQAAQAAELAHLIAIEKIETGRGANQIGTLQRAGDTRWGSHYTSISSLITMFGATFSLLSDISQDGNGPQRGDADAAMDSLTSFEFVLILHLMRQIMGTTNTLCQLLQQKEQDIVNAMNQVSTTKTTIQDLRNDGWEPLLEEVALFCESHGIEMPDMNARYIVGRGRIRPGADTITIEHHYRFDIFNATIDSQLQELNRRFNEQAMELLVLSTALDPKDGFKSFDIDNICNLVHKFYPQDFTEYEKTLLRFQLINYKVDVPNHPHFKNMSSISELCRGLVETNKSGIFYLVDRLIRLVLTLPVSTATTERSFSAMKIVKTMLRNKMDDRFLADNLVVKIEKATAKKFDCDSIIKVFESSIQRRVQFS